MSSVVYPSLNCFGDLIMRLISVSLALVFFIHKIGCARRGGASNQISIVNSSNHLTFMFW